MSYFEYGEYAGQTKVPAAEVEARDKFGNPVSTSGAKCYDLVRDGACKGWSDHISFSPGIL